MATVSTTPHCPAVSVSIITYNQRDLIGRAIDSVLAQRVNFDYEIIIGDDCSDDGTQDILREYQRRHPDKIQLILHPRRYQGEILGRTNNTTNLLNCRGKYTAMLDGDDYWIDPDKLQRQYDLMEARPELSMCLHDAKCEYAPGYVDDQVQFRLMSDFLPHPVKTGTYSHEELASRKVIQPFIGSLFYRSAFLDQFPDWFYDVVAADFALLLILSRQGPVYYEATPSAVYYLNDKGFQQTQRHRQEIIMNTLRDIDTYRHHFPATLKSKMPTRGKARLYWQLSQQDRRMNDIPRAVYHLTTMFRYDAYYGLHMVVKRPITAALRNLRSRFVQPI